MTPVGRAVLSLETARHWHAETLSGLVVPNPRYVGRFRGESGLEKSKFTSADVSESRPER